ncbi:MAG: HEAT repeat domain-containing protein [Verrucomicrobiae bacterium]|nr:HEAT repeat domain-containing protein [Verrucomicrobiae bacterium]
MFSRLPRASRFALPISCLASAAAAISSSAIAQDSNGLEVTPFAQAPLRNITAVHVEDSGRVFAVESTRRKGGEWTLDESNRAEREKSYSFRTIEEKRRWLDELRKSGAAIESVADNNSDGKRNAADLETNSEIIHLLEDRDGDGEADHHQVFADGFNDAMDGIGAGVMSYQGDVFFTCFPNLWRLRDNDGDGLADTREVLHTGFATQLGQRGHDMHGLTIGPYGRLYWSLGDRGFSVVRKEDGKRLSYPYHGAVVRCELDGSNFEVFASGLRNNFEMAFDMHGNLISADNDGDMKGELERLVYILEGSDHGWRRNWQFQTRYNPWMAEHMFEPYFKDQPAHITPPIANFRSGPCGFAYEPGTALNEYYRSCFFMNYAPAGKLFALRLAEDGAAFRMVSQENVLSAGTPTGMNFGPDGALYLADWAGGYERNDKGGIYKLDDPTVAGSSLRNEVRQMLAEGMAKRELPGLPGLLRHADMRIRMEAQFELVRRRAHGVFVRISQDPGEPRIARVHALWGIAQARRQNGFNDIDFVSTLLSDPDSEIRLQAAKVARETGNKGFAAALEAAIKDPSPRVRLHAAMALGRCGSARNIPALIEMLAANDDRDAFLRFGAVLALSELGEVEELAAITTHRSAAARVGAVLALRRLASPAVAAFLKDADPRVVLEAARAIHDDQSIPDALPQLAALANQSLPGNEALIRRILNANVRNGGGNAARRLATFATQESRSLPMRLEALDCLRTWSKPEAFDRVEGNVRANPKGSIEQLADVVPMLVQLTNDPNPEIQAAFTAVVNANHLNLNTAQFFDWLTDTRPLATRLQAFELLVRQDNADDADRAIRLSLDSDNFPLQLAAIRALSAQAPDKVLAHFQELGKSATSIADRRLWIQLLGDWPQGNSNIEPILLRQWATLLDNTLPQELRLDLIQAAARRTEPGIAKALTDYQSSFAATDPLAPYRDSLHGGDPQAGERIFAENAAAQCIRCHRVGGDGSDFGPDLEHVATRLTPEQLLQSLINPSAAIADGYALVTVQTTDGKTIAGTLRKDSATTLEITLPDGTIATVEKRNIAERTAVGISIMPPMGALLKPMELRDVLAYLQSLR